MFVAKRTDCWHRGKFVSDSDIDEHIYGKEADTRLFQPLKHKAQKISWGKPAMFVQGKLDGECPRCSTKQAKDRFEVGFDEGVGCSWAFCHTCEWSYP